MRYPKTHKDGSKQRILQAAATEFRARGISGIGVGDIMRSAGLTQGAFYGHFDSKEDLVQQSIGEARQSSGFVKAMEGKSIEKIIELYLAPWHRDHPERGCPFPALVGEIARHPEETRAIFTREIEEMISLAETLLPGRKKDLNRRLKARSILATLVGALQLSRATTDPVISNGFLDAGKHAALAILSSKM